MKKREYHGLCLSPIDKHLFNVWRNMMDRCYKPTCRQYPWWGGRGIKVCQEWSGPKSFVAWAKQGYSKGLTIERINNDGDYSPGNCRWATMKEQAQNRRPAKTKKNAHTISYSGMSLTISQWDRYFDYPKGTISKRLQEGWTEERALTTPVKHFYVVRGGARAFVAAE